MTVVELKKSAMGFYSMLREEGLTHQLALAAVIEYVFANAGSVASNDASKDAVEGSNLTQDE